MSVRPFPFDPNCPVCGDPAVNPATLGVIWEWDGPRGVAVGRFKPARRHAGYAGIVHGGLIAALLDECLAWACAVRMHAYCVTGKLDLRFKAPAAVGVEIEVSARAVRDWGRYVSARGEVRAANGVVAAATATFVALTRPESERLQAALQRRPEDVDVLSG